MVTTYTTCDHARDVISTLSDRLLVICMATKPLTAIMLIKDTTLVLENSW